MEGEVDGFKGLRSFSIEAGPISDDVIVVLDKSEVVVRRLHIPLHSGSNTVLNRMRRKYTMEFLQ